MSRPDDYEAEMAQTLFDLELERLLSGDTPENDEAADLVALVDLIRAEGDRPPTDAAVALVAGQAASIVLTAPRTGVPTRSPGRKAGWKLRPQVAVVVGAIVILGAFSGVAVAADGAVPGDALYGIDRALEKIGIGAGHAEERLEEARKLLSEGEASEAVRHATQVLTEEEDGSEVGDARAALEDAAVTLEDDGQPSNAPAREDVELLLDYLRANQGKDVGADGREFGQGVADLARDIGPSGDGGPPTSNSGQGNGNGSDNVQPQGGENQDGNGNGNGQPQGGVDQGGGSRNDGSNSGEEAPGNSETAPGRSDS